MEIRLETTAQELGVTKALTGAGGGGGVRGSDSLPRLIMHKAGALVSCFPSDVSGQGGKAFSANKSIRK